MLNMLDFFFHFLGWGGRENLNIFCVGKGDGKHIPKGKPPNFGIREVIINKGYFYFIELSLREFLDIK